MSDWLLSLAMPLFTKLSTSMRRFPAGPACRSFDATGLFSPIAPGGFVRSSACSPRLSAYRRGDLFPDEMFRDRIIHENESAVSTRRPPDQHLSCWRDDCSVTSASSPMPEMPAPYQQVLSCRCCNPVSLHCVLATSRFSSSGLRMAESSSAQIGYVPLWDVITPR